MRTEHESRQETTERRKKSEVKRREEKNIVFVFSSIHKFLVLKRLFDDYFRLIRKDLFVLNEIIYSLDYPADDEEVKLFVLVRIETYPKINIDCFINQNKRSLFTLTDVSTVILSDFSDPYNEPADELCSDVFDDVGIIFCFVLC